MEVWISESILLFANVWRLFLLGWLLPFSHVANSYTPYKTWLRCQLPLFSP